MKKKSIIACAMAGVVGAGFAVPMIFNNSTINSYALSVSDVPDSVKSATVSFFDNEWNEKSTDVKVKVGGGKADISGDLQSGYYIITFADSEFEIGSATFFYGESGQMYSYDYSYSESEKKYVSDFEPISSLKYEKSDNMRALSVDKDVSIEIGGVPSDVIKADVYVRIDDSHYGETKQKISVDADSKTVISDIGRSGEYTVNFYSDSEYPLGYASFAVNNKKQLCYVDVQLNPETNKVENVYVPNDNFYFVSSYDNVGAVDTEETVDYNTKITGIPKNVTKFELQYLTSDMASAETNSKVSLSDGTALINYLDAGYYTLNFYDDDYNTVGYSSFYMDYKGNLFSYDRADSITVPEYNAMADDFVYKEGDVSVNIYGVPDSVDTVEACYKYGSETDESAWFEPEISSVYKEPLTVSGFGQEGDYQLVFYSRSEITGYADFYLDENGNTFYHDIDYNSTTGKPDDVLKETDKVYYYVKNDIGSAENYSYGDTALTITGIPDEAVCSEIIDFEDDSTFTVGLPIFPEVSMNGNGKAVIENFGEAGYYEINFMKDDNTTKVGYVFIYIDENMNIYDLEYGINSDTYQLDETKKRTDTVSMKPCSSGVEEYSHGNKSVTIKNVPSAVNRMYVSCSAESGEFSFYEAEIHPDKSGNAVIKNLGTEGEYNVILMDEKTDLGIVSFYLNKDGSVCEISYGDDGAEYTPVDSIKFVDSGNSAVCVDGDLDFNGLINVADLVIMQKHIVAQQNMDSSQLCVSDVNKDGVTDAFDMVTMRKKLLKTSE